MGSIVGAVQRGDFNVRFSKMERESLFIQSELKKIHTNTLLLMGCYHCPLVRKERVGDIFD